MTNRQDGKGFNPEKIAWADDRPRERPYEVLHPRPGEPVSGVLLGGEIAAVMLHWLGYHSHPCEGPGCKRPHTRRDPYWYGYLPLATAGSSVPAILGVSAGAWKRLQRLRDCHGGLRGLYVELARGAGPRARTVVRLVSEEKVGRLREPFDVRPYLLDMWDLVPLPADPAAGPAPARAEQMGRLARLAADLFAANGCREGGAG